jgi:hypothetical protein
VVGDTVLPSTATVAITGGFQLAQDVLGFTNVPASHGNIAGSYDATTGVLTLTSAGAAATLAQWQAALRAVTYTVTVDNPNTGTRTLSLKLSGTGFESAVVTKSVSVTAVNDAPVATTSSGATAAIKQTAVAIDSGLTVVDADNATLASGILAGVSIRRRAC